MNDDDENDDLTPIASSIIRYVFLALHIGICKCIQYFLGTRRMDAFYEL